MHVPHRGLGALTSMKALKCYVWALLQCKIRFSYSCNAQHAVEPYSRMCPYMRPCDTSNAVRLNAHVPSCEHQRLAGGDSFSPCPPRWSMLESRASAGNT